MVILQRLISNVSQDGIVITATSLRAGPSGVRLLTGEGDFFPNVQTVSGAHLASYVMGPGGSFLLRCGWGVRLATHIYRVSRLRMNGALPPLPLYVFVTRIRTNTPVTYIARYVTPMFTHTEILQSN
jgi:hypothetical protein